MEHLPITYYHIGQRIEVNEIDQVRAEVLELSSRWVSFTFGQERAGLRYTRSVSPEFVKPVLRPLAMIRISHVIGLYRLVFFDTKKADDEILQHVAQLQAKTPNILDVWADSTEPCLWLASIGYDMQGLIKKGLAVADED